MNIASISVQNFRTFQNAEARDLPGLAVCIGRNGSGRTVFFDAFSFLHDCLHSSVTSALAERGGYREVISRGHEGEDISLAIRFRQSSDEPMLAYELSVGPDDRKRIVVQKEALHLLHGENGSPCTVLQFSRGTGCAVSGELTGSQDVRLTERKTLQLAGPDIPAISGLGQFREYVAAAAVRKQIEDWHVSDFRIDAIRKRHEADHDSQLTRSGDNLAVVTKYIHDTHPDLFARIISRMKQYVPDVDHVDVQEMQDGYILLRFRDGRFRNPFSADSVSDGALRMFLYLIALYSPTRHALLCIENPEHHLYPELVQKLAQEFQTYSSDSQIFLSTHSPDLLSAVPLNAVYVLEKKNGCTTIQKAIDNPLARSLYEAGESAGSLWREGILMQNDQ